MIGASLARTIRSVVPERARSAIRSKAFALRPPTMSVGVGRGLRFDPGRSNGGWKRTTSPAAGLLDRNVIFSATSLSPTSYVGNMESEGMNRGSAM